MHSVNFKLKMVFFPLICYAALASTQDPPVTSNITIPLDRTPTPGNAEIYGDFLKLNTSSTVHVDFTDVASNLSFIIFQVHSQFDNVTLYINEKKNDTQVQGTDVGLASIIYPTSKMDTFYIENPSENNTFRVYISVHGYGENDPIPGGCNMEFPTEIAPYMRLVSNRAYITVDTAPPSVDPKCLVVNQPTVTFYMMYLPVLNFHADEYFDGIRKMMTYDSIIAHGKQVPMTHWTMRRMVAAYPGNGVIFVAVAQSNNSSSVYVPTHSYGCPGVVDESCIFAYDVLTEIFIALLLFIGAFVTFFGHRFFKTEMFLAGFFGGFIVTYILVAYLEDGDLDTPALLAASALSGIFFGAIWLLFWWLYGIPVVAVLMPALLVGFILAALFYFIIPVHILYLEEPFNFWALFILVMLLAALALVSVAYAANIVCCSLLGAFAAIYAIDCIAGTNVKYIIIDTLRRAIVPKFNLVLLMPPLSPKELEVTIAGVGLAAVGFAFQHWHNRSRPPFPPPPRSTRLAAPGEPTSYGAVTEHSRRQTRQITTIRHHLTGSPVVSRTYSERTYLLGE